MTSQLTCKLFTLHWSGSGSTTPLAARHPPQSNLAINDRWTSHTHTHTTRRLSFHPKPASPRSPRLRISCHASCLAPHSSRRCQSPRLISPPLCTTHAPLFTRSAPHALRSSHTDRPRRRRDSHPSIHVDHPCRKSNSPRSLCSMIATVTGAEIAGWRHGIMQSSHARGPARLACLAPHLPRRHSRRSNSRPWATSMRAAACACHHHAYVSRVRPTPTRL